MSRVLPFNTLALITCKSKVKCAERWSRSPSRLCLWSVFRLFCFQNLHAFGVDKVWVTNKKQIMSWCVSLSWAALAFEFILPRVELLFHDIHRKFVSHCSCALRGPNLNFYPGRWRKLCARKKFISIFLWQSYYNFVIVEMLFQELWSVVLVGVQCLVTEWQWSHSKVYEITEVLLKMRKSCRQMAEKVRIGQSTELLGSKRLKLWVFHDRHLIPRHPRFQPNRRSANA